MSLLEISSSSSCLNIHSNLNFDQECPNFDPTEHHSGVLISMESAWSEIGAKKVPQISVLRLFLVLAEQVQQTWAFSDQWQSSSSLKKTLMIVTFFLTEALIASSVKFSQLMWLSWRNHAIMVVSMGIHLLPWHLRLISSWLVSIKIISKDIINMHRVSLIITQVTVWYRQIFRRPSLNCLKFSVELLFPVRGEEEISGGTWRKWTADHRKDTWCEKRKTFFFLGIVYMKRRSYQVDLVELTFLNARKPEKDTQIFLILLLSFVCHINCKSDPRAVTVFVFSHSLCCLLCD